MGREAGLGTRSDGGSVARRRLLGQVVRRWQGSWHREAGLGSWVEVRWEVCGTAAAFGAGGEALAGELASGSWAWVLGRGQMGGLRHGGGFWGRW